MPETSQTPKISMKKISKILNIIVLISFIILIFFVCWCLFLYGGSEPYEADYGTEDYAIEESIEERCNVMGIELHGNLLTYLPNSDFDSGGGLLYDEVGSEDIVYSIEQAEESPNIKAILLEIDSSGGLPLAGEEIADALKRATKPTGG